MNAEIQLKTGLIHAVVLDGNGGAREIDWTLLETWQPEAGVLWMHMHYQDPDVQHWLTEQSGLQSVCIDALLSEETRPRTTKLGNGTLIALRGVNLHPEENPEDMVSIRLWVEQNRIISTRARMLKSVSEITASLEDGNGPCNSGELIVDLCERLTSNIENTIDSIDTRLSDLEEEEESVSESYRHRSEIAKIRRMSIRLRRYLTPQREALIRLSTVNVTWMTDTNQLYLRETIDKLVRNIEDLDNVGDRATLAQEELTSRLSESFNNRLYVLSIVSALFLPLGFLTGLLGVNVGGIPGAETPLGFTLFLVVILIVVVCQLLLFRKLKWL